VGDELGDQRNDNANQKVFIEEAISLAAPEPA